MERFHVMIVDDQREIRQVLRTALKASSHEYTVIELSSAEEAILEFSNYPIDLLIADINLPGIHGLELIRRIKNQGYDPKVILLTSHSNPQLRRMVADAGAYAYFLKPVQISEIMDAVERCLGINLPVSHPKVFIETNSTPGRVSQRLSEMRKELDAISVVLIDDSGRVLARAGSLPDSSEENSLLPSLMAAFSAGNNVSSLLGVDRPQNISFISGVQFDFILSNLGNAYALLVAMNPKNTKFDLGAIFQIVGSVTDELVDLLVKIGVRTGIVEESEIHISSPLPLGIFEEDTPGITPEFPEISEASIPSDDVEAFWDSVSRDDVDHEANRDVLTYEQAKLLGLTPDDDGG
jgi:DNA-binding NarL/FixJ family response regulator